MKFSQLYKKIRRKFFSYLKNIDFLSCIHPPIGSYKSIFDYIKLINDKNEADFIKIHDTQKYDRGDSIILDGETSKIGSGIKEVSPAYIYTLSNCQILDRNGKVITHDNKFIEDITMAFDPEGCSLFDRPKPVLRKKIKGNVAVISTNYAVCYYHWMFDIFQRFFLLESNNIQYDKLVVNKLKYPYQKQSMDLLGIPKEKIVETSDNVLYFADKIITTSFHYFDPILLPLVRKGFLHAAEKVKFTKQMPERIYISRDKAKYRKIANEDELNNFLEHEGFTRVFLEELSFIEQLTLFKNAKIVIGPHGAGFTNIIFSNPGLKVIEIFSPGYDNGCFHPISAIFNHNHCHIYGEQINEKNDIYVKLDSVKKILEKTIKV